MALLIAACGGDGQADADAAGPDAAPEEALVPYALDLGLGISFPGDVLVSVGGQSIELSSSSDPTLRISFESREEAASFEEEMVVSGLPGGSQRATIRFDECNAIQALGFDPEIRSRTELLWSVSPDSLNKGPVRCYLDTRKRFDRSVRALTYGVEVAGVPVFTVGSAVAEPSMIHLDALNHYEVTLSRELSELPTSISDVIALTEDGMSRGSIDANFERCLSIGASLGMAEEDLVWQRRGAGLIDGQLVLPADVGCDCGYRDGSVLVSNDGCI